MNFQARTFDSEPSQLTERFGQLMDPSTSTVSPRVFADPELYRLEQERVFGRSWLYVGHESQIPEAGDFVMASMGEESVIVARGRDMQIRVMINSCRHRGMRLCRVDHGKARTFQCPYHGWTFNTEGKLVAIPGFEPGYHGDLNADDWGLIQVPKVDSYRGLIFACYDENTVSLSDYLGNAKWYLDLFLNRTAGGMKVLPGVAKTKWSGNWKFGAEQLGGDQSHTPFTHAFLPKLGMFTDVASGDAWDRNFQVKCDNGHGFILVSDNPHLPPPLIKFREWMAEEAKGRVSEEQLKLIDTVHVGTIFPNFSFIEVMGSLFVRCWQPRGVGNTEMWTWLLTEAEAPPEVTAIQREISTLNFGPAGIIESDDSDMWVGCSESSRGFLRQQMPYNYAMSHGHGVTSESRPGIFHRTPTEIGAFGFHERWNELMQQELPTPVTKF